MLIKTTLIAINSKPDKYGCCEWAFRFIDHENEKEVVGRCIGGESNINAIRRQWDPDLDDWDRSMQCFSQTLPIREFNRLVKGWKHAGCATKDLVNFIKQELANQ